MQLPLGNWVAPPDGNRSRLFLSFLGISLRAAGHHQFRCWGGERNDVMSSMSTLLPRENRMESCSQNPSAIYLETVPTAANKPIET